MPLAYRSFFRVRDEPRLLELATQQLNSWLRSKQWDIDALRFGAARDIAPDVVGVALSEEPRDGTRTTRYRFVQGTGWVTELTIHQGRSEHDSWVWIDLESPEKGPSAKTPRLAGDLLAVLHGRDGDHLLGAGPRIVRVDEVGSVVDALTDLDRRGHLFIAGTSSDLPVDKWSGYVGKLLKETVGLAASYVLDAEATVEFNALTPQSHRVDPGTVRTFQPGADLSNPLESVRHRVLGTSRIVRDDVRVLQSLLGRRSRELSLTASLPGAVIRLDRRLREQLDAHLFEQLDASPRRPDLPLDVTTQVETIPEEPVPSVPLATTTRITPAVDDVVLDALRRVIIEVTGSGELSVAVVKELGARAQAVDRLTRATTSVRTRLHRLENEADLRDDEIAQLRRSLDDEKQDRAIAETERAESDRQLRHLRSELARVAKADTAWDPPSTAEDIWPQGFDDLLERFGELECLEFTGKASITRDLDDHDDLGTWAGLCWEALLALRDYARSCVAGSWTGNVEAYLNGTPGELHGFPPNKHARDESADVHNNRKYRTPRMLPVPRNVNADGRVFMGAHFKIAQYGMISPRMHYLDDILHSGKIYVGYIGPHLPTSKTN
ncbi:hypothetical protein [Nocardia fluminea]|uniref:hypothetical protein n=1 Tax=Nocardia fluminea TaxID=134984 RepID=UPI0037B37D0C